MTHLLFVYGTLRARSGSPQAERLAAGSSLLGTAWTRGEVVAVHGFPALRQSRSGRVEGELLHVRDPALWDELDAFEGVGERGWYRRQLIVAIDERDEPRSCWAYVAADSPAPSRLGA